LTTIVDAGGLSLNRTKELIEKLKTELRSVGVREGIQLKSGATYTGSVVEMFGFESVDHATSKAAIELRDAINA
jgi:ABC-type Fe3+-citrate transport system substrate-binding protein